MKKIFVLLLAVVLALSLFTACGGSDTGVLVPVEDNIDNEEEATPQTSDQVVNLPTEPPATEKPIARGTKPMDFGLGKRWEIKGGGFHPNIFNINNDYTWICLLEDNSILGLRYDSNLSRLGAPLPPVTLATNVKTILAVYYDYIVFLDMNNTLWVSDFEETKEIMTGVVDAKIGGNNSSNLLALCDDGSVYYYAVGRATNSYSKNEDAGPWLLADDGARLISMSDGRSGSHAVFLSQDGYLFSAIEDSFDKKYVKAAIEPEWQILVIGSENASFHQNGAKTYYLSGKGNRLLLAYDAANDNYCTMRYLDTVDGTEDKAIYNESIIPKAALETTIKNFVEWRDFFIPDSYGYSQFVPGNTKDTPVCLVDSSGAFFLSGSKIADNVKTYDGYQDSRIWYVTEDGGFYLSDTGSIDKFELKRENVGFAYLINSHNVVFLFNDGQFSDIDGNIIATNVKLQENIVSETNIGTGDGVSIIEDSGETSLEQADSFDGVYVSTTSSNQYGASATLTTTIILQNGKATQKQGGSSSAGGQTINIPETSMELGEFSVRDNKFILRGSEMGTFENGELTYLGMTFTKR